MADRFVRALEDPSGVSRFKLLRLYVSMEAELSCTIMKVEITQH